MKNIFRNSNSNIIRSLVLAFAFALLTHIPTAAAAATSPVQVQMGSNAPVGRILSLELVVNSVQLVTSKGVSVPLVATPFTLEQSHLAASAEVVGHANLPTGTYTKAVINSGNPHVIFLDNFGNLREARWTGSSVSTVVLKQPISATTAASVIRISLNMGSLVSFNPALQLMFRTQPTFAVSQWSPTRTGADAEVAGELEPAIGRVTAVAASSFTVTDVVNGLVTTYLTDHNTAYNGLSPRTMPNLLVRIHATTRSDGQLLAEEVTVAGSGAGAIVTGIITDYAGTKLTTQQAYGAGATITMLGSNSNITLDAASSFEVESRGMDLTGLNVTFGSANLVPGQRIQFLSRASIQNSAATGASLTHALTARLQLQSISGTVTNIAQASNGGASFDLILPANDSSPLTSLGEGSGIVHVVTQPLTKSVLTLSEGLAVRVRGLLLFDASPLGSQHASARDGIVTPKDASNYYMIARTMQRDSASHN